MTGGVPREQQWWPQWFRYPQLVLELHDHELNYDLLHGIAMIVESAEHLERKLLTIMRLAAPIERLPEFLGDATMLWEQACRSADDPTIYYGCLLAADMIVRCWRLCRLRLVLHVCPLHRSSPVDRAVHVVPSACPSPSFVRRQMRRSARWS